EIIPPCIDVFSPKNQLLEDGTVAAILDRASIVSDGRPDDPVFVRQNGEPAHVTSRAHMLDDAPIPPGAPVVTQISRWDPLKDHRGVMLAFAEHVPESLGAHL